MRNKIREIKFRGLGTKGWAPTENKGWYYGTSIFKEQNKDKQVFSLYRFEKMLQGNYIDSKTRCQYTGLKDKHSVEIYEGDVCRVDHYDYDDNLVEKIGVINYRESRAYFKIDYINTKSKSMDFIGNLDIEVIGNIYQNPELLELADD